MFAGLASFGQPSNPVGATKNLAFNSPLEAATFAESEQPNPNYLELFLASSVKSDTHIDAYMLEFEAFMDKLKKKQKQYASDNQFLWYLFYKVHNKFLKHYHQYGTLTDLFEKGRYDCLTGTSFYALVLDRLGYQYRVFETSYHTLLLVDTPDRQYLFESTDFANGFLNDPLDISERLDHYKGLSASRDKDGSYYNFQNNSNYLIGLREMVGLQYYNQAIKFYNLRQIARAGNCVDKALVFYQSPRIKEFSKIVQSALQSGLFQRQAD